MKGKTDFHNILILHEYFTHVRIGRYVYGAHSLNSKLSFHHFITNSPLLQPHGVKDLNS